MSASERASEERRAKSVCLTLAYPFSSSHRPSSLPPSLDQRYFAGKVFGRDHEVQQGAARVRGESHTLPEEVKHPRTKQAEAEAAKGGAQTQGGI